ncbi:MAG TPA: rod-binding protein [Rhizomicrobium sp.]|jgi:Rod binding domain-containing protein
MDTNYDVQNALSMARNTPVRAPRAGQSADATTKAAKDFEAVFISQFMGSMFEGVQTDGLFGGGQGEQMFRSLMLDQYSQQMANQGGFGIAKAVTRSLNEHQQAQQRAQAEAEAKANGKPVTPETPSFPTQKPQPTFAAHAKAPESFSVGAKAAPVFAAHPATVFAVSAAASRSLKRSVH